jgi:hypothetical protein
MRVVLIGTPETDKLALAWDLRNVFPSLTIRASSPEILLRNQVEKFNTSEFGDYRTELMLGTIHALELRCHDDSIFVETSLDRVATTYVRYSDFSRSGIQDEGIHTRYFLTSALLYAMLTDSFEADVLLRLPLPKSDDEKSFYARVDDFYDEIIDYFELKPVVLDGTYDENLSRAQAAIKEAYGSRSDSEESSSEESS